MLLKRTRSHEARPQSSPVFPGDAAENQWKVAFLPKTPQQPLPKSTLGHTASQFMRGQDSGVLWNCPLLSLKH